MTLPNLIIAGAPKCGTSSLFNWLVDHPDVCGSSVKETFFLMDEENPLRRKACNFHDHGLAAYSDFFPDCSARDKVVVEATTHYLYQQTAREVLASLATEPKIIFVLRKPSDRVYSSFSYTRNNLGRVTGDLSFPEFLRLAESDPAGGALKGLFGPSGYVLARDIQYSRYVEFLLAWRKCVGAGRMRILLFEEMSTDPRRMVEGLCIWLGINPSFYDGYDFAARNQTVGVRSPRLQRLAITLAGSTGDSKLKRLLKRVYLRLQADRAGKGRPVADEAALRALERDFKPWNAELAAQFGLNLDCWAAPSPRGRD